MSRAAHFISIPDRDAFRIKRLIAESLSECPSLSTPDNIQTIIGQLPFKDISYNPQANLHVLNIVNAAFSYSSGLEILIETVSAFDEGKIEMQTVYETLDKVIPIGIEWHALFSLRRIVEMENPDKNAIKEAFYLTSRAEISICDACGNLLICCLETLAKQSHDAERAPLIEFLTKLLSEVDESVRDEITDWITGLADELGTTLDKISLCVRAQNHCSAAFENTPYLLVKVDPSDWEKDENEYHIKAWMLYQGEAKLLPAPQSPIVLNEIPKLLKDLIFQSREFLLSKFNRPTAEIDKLIIEVILPFELLTVNIDEWKIKAREFSPEIPLGHFLPLVVRSLERIYNRKLRNSSMGSWEKKWNSRPKTITAADIYLASVETDYSGNFFDKLIEGGSVFLGLTLSPPPDSNLEAYEILGQVVEAGTPIAFFLREINSDTHPIRTEIETFIFNNETDQIPTLIHGKRSAVFTGQAANPCWKSITLMWDDPDRLPPDVSFNLSSP